MSILIIGGAGRTGRHIVTQLSKLGHTTKILSRRAKSNKTTEVIRGDITDITSVTTAVKDMTGVVIVVESSESDSAPNSPEKVHYQGTLNVLDALKGSSIPLLMVSQIYITRPERYPEVANIIRWRDEGEKAIRKSGQPYIIVRPSWLTDEPAGQQRLRLEQGDTGDGRVSREDVGIVCANALFSPEAHGKTFELYGEAGKPVTDWQVAFRNLKVDSKLAL